MNSRSCLLLLLLVLLALAGCQATGQVEPQATLAPTSTSALGPTEPALLLPAAGPDTASPAGVVEAFYTWYLDPDHEGDFRSSPYLSERYIQSLDQALKNNPYLGADPFLLAQSVPGAIRVEPVSQDAQTARVVLHQIFNPGTEVESLHDLSLDLIYTSDGWKIDRIQVGSPFSARGVVQLFYNWYLAGNQGQGGRNYALRQDGNPLTGRAYRSSPYLAPSLVRQVDSLLDDPGELIYDPFLLARTHPGSVWQMPPEEETGDQALVPVQVFYGRQTELIEVHVVRQGKEWQIVEIAGAIPTEATTAAQVVSLLYSRHFNLWYDYANRHDLPHTAEELDLTAFWQENAASYQDDPLLSPGFAARVSQLPAGEQPLNDPFFLAPGIPLLLEVGEVQVDGNQAQVAAQQKWIIDHQIQTLTVTLESQDSHWQITGVSKDENAVASVPAEASPGPDEVLRAFFAEYLAGGGWNGGTAASSPYLAEGFVENLENSDLSYYRERGVPVDQYDPILHSAALVVPLSEIRLDVETVQVDAEFHRAQAVVNRVYPTTGTVLPLYISLVRGWDHQWRIMEIQTTSPESELLPAWEAGYLYSWLLAYRQEPENSAELAELFRIPVADEEGIHFCSDEWPLGISVDGAFVEPPDAEGQQRVWVLLRSSHKHHLFTVEMVGQAQQWQIVDHHCGNTAANRALAFYTWHLGGWSGALDSRVALENEFLATNLALAVDDMRASLANSQYDPFVQSESRPDRFWVEAGPDDGSALVHLSFPDGTSQTLQLTFVLADGRWLLSNLTGSSG